MAIAINILGQYVGGSIDDTKGRNGIWFAGNSYVIEVTGQISIIDTLNSGGYHVSMRNEMLFCYKLEGLYYLQPFQTLSALNAAYDMEASGSASSANRIYIDTEWTGNRVCNISTLSSTITGTTNLGYVSLGTVDIPINPYTLTGRRIIQEFTTRYLISLRSESVAPLGSYYFACWRNTTPLGESDEGQITQIPISGTLAASYIAAREQYDTFYGYYKYSQLDVNTYFNYAASDLVTLKVSVLGVGDIEPLPDFPSTRPVDYDPDQIWTPDEWVNPIWVPEVIGPPYVPGEWTDDEYVPSDWSDPGLGLVAAGGGNYNQNLVCVGMDLVYYEEFS